jgi:hypothetical protein
VPLASVTGRPTVVTQRTFFNPTHGSSPRVCVDMLIKCRQQNGDMLVIISEHKWDSPTDAEQLITYRQLLNNNASFNKIPGPRSLVFIGATAEQRQKAEGHCDSALLWEELPHIFHNISAPPLVRQFLGFLEAQKLWYPALTKTDLQQGGTTMQTRAARLMKRLQYREWESIPSTWRKADWRIHYGRRGIIFGKDWKPYIFVGIQEQTPELGFSMCDPAAGPDLIFAIGVDRVTRDLRSKAIQLRLPHLRTMASEVCGPRERGGYFLKVVVRKPLAQVIRDDQSSYEQADAIYEQLQTWCRCFFATDGVTKAIRDAFMPKVSTTPMIMMRRQTINSLLQRGTVKPRHSTIPSPSFKSLTNGDAPSPRMGRGGGA